MAANDHWRILLEEGNSRKVGRIGSCASHTILGIRGILGTRRGHGRALLNYFDPPLA